MAGKGSFWLGILVGAAAGAASAILYAPKKGNELRSDIADTARQAGRKAGEAWGDVKEKASGVASSAKDRAAQMADRGREMMACRSAQAREAIQAGRKAAEEKRRELKAHMEAKESDTESKE